LLVFGYQIRTRHRDKEAPSFVPEEDKAAHLMSESAVRAGSGMVA
jgi:hypothetical protein